MNKPIDDLYNKLLELQKSIYEDIDLTIYKNADHFFNREYIKEKYRNTNSFDGNLEYLRKLLYYLNEQIKNLIENNDIKTREFFENWIINILFDNLISKTSRLLTKFKEEALSSFEVYFIEYRNIIIEHIDDYSLPHMEINNFSITNLKLNFWQNPQIVQGEIDTWNFRELIDLITKFRDKDKEKNIWHTIYEWENKKVECFTDDNIKKFIDDICLQHFKEIKNNFNLKKSYNEFKRFKELLIKFPIPWISFADIYNILNEKTDLLSNNNLTS